MSRCGEPCDGCANRATHHLCDQCCEEDSRKLKAERDEARAEASRLDDEAIYQRGLYESARAEVERLRADNADLLARLDAAAFSVPQGLRDVAERQRDACAKAAEEDVSLGHTHEAVRATPLVTEGDE